MDVNVEVTERPTGTFQIGAGFSSVENFIAQAQISQNNLLGRGQLLTLQAQLSSLRQLFLLQFQDLYFLDTNWTFGFNLFKQDQFLFSFVRSSKGGSLTWGYLLAEDTAPAPDLHARGRERLDRRLQRRSSPAPRSSRRRSARSRTCCAPASPRRGARCSRTTRATTACSRPRAGTTRSRARSRTRSSLSENVFTRYEAVARASTRSGGRSCCASRRNAGLIASRDAARRADLRALLRGRHLRRPRLRAALARAGHPRARRDRPQDSPLRSFLVGGNMQVIGNAEIEFPIFDKVGIRGVVFTDIGNAFNLEDQYCTLSAVRRRRQQGPLQRPARLSRLPRELGLRLPLVLAHRPAAVRVGHPVPDAPRRAADRLRVHDRKLLLNVLSKPSGEGDDRTCHARPGSWSLPSSSCPRSSALAEDIKLGYVDMQRALNETEDGRKAKANLKKVFDQKQKELDEQQAELKKDIEDLDKKRTLLPADKVREKEAELQGAHAEGAADLPAPPAGSVRPRSRRPRQDLRADEQDHRQDRRGRELQR